MHLKSLMRECQDVANLTAERERLAGLVLRLQSKSDADAEIFDKYKQRVRKYFDGKQFFFISAHSRTISVWNWSNVRNAGAL